MRITGVDTIVGTQYHQTCQLRRHVMFAHRRSPSNKCDVHFRQFIQFAVVYLSFHPSLIHGKIVFVTKISIRVILLHKLSSSKVATSAKY